MSVADVMSILLPSCGLDQGFEIIFKITSQLFKASLVCALQDSCLNFPIGSKQLNNSKREETPR